MSDSLQSDPQFIRQQMGWPEPETPKRRATYIEPDWAEMTRRDHERWYGTPNPSAYRAHMAALDALASGRDDDDRHKIRAEEEDV